MAIVVASIVLLLFNNSWIMAHFGRKPVRGGRPPVDKRIMDVIGIRIGVLFHICDIELIVVDKLVCRIMNIGIVRIM